MPSLPFPPSSTAISHLLLPSTFPRRDLGFLERGKESKGGKGYLSEGGSGSADDVRGKAGADEEEVIEGVNLISMEGREEMKRMRRESAYVSVIDDEVLVEMLVMSPI